MDNFKNLWMRLGVTLHITDEEAQILMSDDSKGTETLRNILNEKRYEIDGDSYIPDCEVVRYNKTNGTDFLDGDCEFCL